MCGFLEYLVVVRRMVERECVRDSSLLSDLIRLGHFNKEGL